MIDTNDKRMGRCWKALGVSDAEGMKLARQIPGKIRKKERYKAR
jgi:hypothetical protein